MNYTLKPSTDDSYVHIIDYGTENQIEVCPYKQNKAKRLFALFLFIISFGIVGLIFHWKRHWFIKFTCNKRSLDDCDLLVITDKNKLTSVSYVKYLNAPDNNELRSIKEEFLDVPDLGGKFSHQKSIKYFEHHKNLYIWRGHKRGYTNINEFEKDLYCSYFYKQDPLTKEAQDKRRLFFGPNDIKVKVRPIYKILFYEVLTPFYIFQIFSVILWFNDEYELYASCILIISLLSLGQSTYEIRKDQLALHNLSKMIDIVTVFRNDKFSEDIPSVDLVPGDIIKIPPKGCLMTCDAIVLNGSCIVNESMLTGESIPVTKTPLPNLVPSNTYDYKFERKKQFKHLLFCGTQVIQARYYGTECTKAIVLSTGFNTIKGEIIRSILFPKPSEFNFNQDSYKFIAALFGLSIIGFIYSSVLKIMSHFPLRLIILRSIDLVTIVVPPALPAAMTIGIVFAKSRLKKYNIFCISPNHINVCGVIDLMCFDKTGTLTEDGLDIWGIIPYQTGNATFSPTLKSAESAPMGSLLYCMASCHSLTTIDGELIGDPLDIKMFQSTNWQLKEPSIDDSEKYDMLVPTIVTPPTSYADTKSRAHSNSMDYISPYEIGIIRQFPFLSVFQRMSVIIYRLESKEYEIYCKGSPEKISSLCDPNTLPPTFHSDLMAYTEKGFRVIALAWKALPTLKWAKIQRINRDQVERDLTFLGLLVFENKLKDATVPTLRVLKRGNIRTVMVTGDNLLTAVSVARESHMIEPSSRVKLIEPDFGPGSGDRPTGIRVVGLESTAESSSFGPNLSSLDNGYPSVAPTPLSDVTFGGMGLSGARGIKGPKHSVPQCHLAMTGDTFQTLLDNNLPLLERILAASAEPFLGEGDDSIKSLTQSSDAMAQTPSPDQRSKASTPGHNGPTGPVVATVFARMTPDQKAALVERFQALDYYVGMCGDGANDCGALKTAHAGVALSDAEASIVSPFTYRGKDIRACVPLIQEGRCALVTSFGVFKYMAGYSLTQFVSVLILYWVGASFSDQQFAYVDLCIITLHAITFGRTRAYSVANRRRSTTTGNGSNGPKPKLESSRCDPLKLCYSYLDSALSACHKTSRCLMGLLSCGRSKPLQPTAPPVYIDDDRIFGEKLAREPPNSSLVSFAPIFSVVTQLLIQTSFLIGTYFWTKGQPWYVPYDPLKDPEEEFFTHMVTAIFYVSAFQYIIQALVTAKGPPYRMPAYTNPLFMASAAFSIAFTSFFLVLYPLPSVAKFFYLEPLPIGADPVHGIGPFSPRVFILILAVADLTVSLAFERLVVDKVITPLTKNRDLFLRPKWPRHIDVARADREDRGNVGPCSSPSYNAIVVDKKDSSRHAKPCPIKGPQSLLGRRTGDVNQAHANYGTGGVSPLDSDEESSPSRQKNRKGGYGNVEPQDDLYDDTDDNKVNVGYPSRASFGSSKSHSRGRGKGRYCIDDNERRSPSPCLQPLNTSSPELGAADSTNPHHQLHPAFRDTLMGGLVGEQEMIQDSRPYLGDCDDSRGRKKRGSSYNGPPLFGLSGIDDQGARDKSLNPRYTGCSETALVPLGKLYIPKDITKL